MKRDEDPPKDEQRGEPGSSRRVRWPERLSPDDLQQWRVPGTESDTPAPFATEEWIEEFCTQYNRKLMESVLRYAARRLSRGGPVSPYSDDAETLAWDALSDTLSGDSRWDPESKPLKGHLLDVVKRRTSAAWARAKHLPHISIDQLGRNGRTSRDEMERAIREQHADARDAENARDHIAEVRRHAADDPDVLALIDARAKKETAGIDPMLVTGFSPQRFRAARRRLKQIREAMIREALSAELDLSRNGKE